MYKGINSNTQNEKFILCWKISGELETSIGIRL